MEKSLAIIRKIKKYAEGNIHYEKIIKENIQLFDLADLESDYHSHLINENSKYFPLLAFFHGAISVKSNAFVNQYEQYHNNEDEFFSSIDETFVDFQKKDLKLLWGMFCFVDPKVQDDVESISYYLLGSMQGKDLKPSFSFKQYINITNNRGNFEAIPYPNDWLAFYLDINTLFRREISFSDDYPSYFSKKNYRRNDIEKKEHFLYVSSGEIDHAILQWIFSLKNKDINPISLFDSDILFDIKSIDKSIEMIPDDMKARHKKVIDKVFISNSSSLFLNFNDSSVANLGQWLKKFGFLNEGNMYTERLVSAIEFFYFNLRDSLKLVNDENYSFNTKNYYYNGENYYAKNSNHPQIDVFLNKCRALLPVEKEYSALINDESFENRFSELLFSYLTVLHFFGKDDFGSAEDFAQSCRFPLKSYFFQRCTIGLYNSRYIEKACKGLVVFPILGNQNLNKNDLPFVGYFLGLIKDSDDKGRCYFNWRTHSNEKTLSKSTHDFYNNHIFNIQNIAFTIGRIESQQIYYKGILRKYLDNQSRHATQSAISQVLARNMSHNIGSHVSYRATNVMIKKRAKAFSREILKHAAFEQWLDYFSEKLDKYEIYRNEYLSDFDQSPRFVRFYQDLVLPFCENMFVMDNITAGEHLHYQDAQRNKLKIVCKIDGQEIQAAYPDLCDMLQETEKEVIYPDNFPYLLKHKRFDTAEPDKSTLESAMNHRRLFPVGRTDVEICIHSEQALYSILENFIRNSAKHKEKTVGKQEELTVVLDLRHENNNETEKNNYYTLFLYSESSGVAKSVLCNRGVKNRGIYQRIRQGLLDDSGKPLRENWGFADMKINSFLLFNPVESISDETLDDNFELVVHKGGDKFISVNDDSEEAIFDRGEDGPYEFGYKIKLSIARKVLWIGPVTEGIDVEVFEKEGLVLVADIIEATCLSQKNIGLQAFQFVVINMPFGFQEFTDLEHKLPGRVLVVHPDCQAIPAGYSRIVKITKELPEFDEMRSLLRWCWREWIIMRNESVNLVLYFDNNEVAGQWEQLELESPLSITNVNLLKEPFILQDTQINVVFHHHGGAFNQNFTYGRKSRKIECLKDDKGEEILDFIKKHSIIFFGKGSEDFSTIHYPPDQVENKEMLVYQLMDAATTNIFIIDERINNYGEEAWPSAYGSQGKVIDTYLGYNLNMYADGKLFLINFIKNDTFMCPIGIEKSSDESILLCVADEDIALESAIAGLEDIDTIRKDILIIHRTYLDSVKIGTDVSKFIALVKRKFGSVFVTSGGGYPHSLNDIECKFIPFSILEACVNTRLSKNKLVTLLNSNIR